MYIPKHFEMDDQEGIYDVIEQNGFATLVSQHQGLPYATHLPLTLDRDLGVLYCHVARPNTQWKDIEGQDVLAIFQGPHSYISPSWYETNKAVPTWNYVSVHVYGRVAIVNDEQELMDSLKDMVNKYEKPDSSYNLSEVDPAYIKGLSQGIVGLKIKIDKLEGKKKLSQNHPIERQELVIQQLEKSTSDEAKQVAQLMRKNL
ncbi:FMN-binding negative transcriptional regulator [Alkalihalobacillus sp. AL-G]|uniref:FMN-binding negative transcriptional regulator n=1 Tax=Alkalihalobacillus sp. AL-G TaxID=2926399 RepID=UPI00272D9AAD|nr:FMN-binding negative transcriptional regulator [Alkalihalobacillus sp. AL-G]WLD93767.1 FMN-binding negative transcriptional regulator [Alkalihalobacillus sp. AL-G]